MKKFMVTVLFILCSVAGLCLSAQNNDDAGKSNIDVVKNMYKNFAEGNVPEVLASMAPEVEWIEAENFPYADGNPYIGPNAVLEGVFMRLGTEWEYWKLNDLEFYPVTTGEVVVTGRYNAKYKKNGNVINAQFVHIWRLDNGKVIKFQQYADTYKVMQAISPATNDPHH